MAFVYDATAKTLSCYVDYYQSKTIALPGEMKWDAGSLFIGGGPGKSTFGGQIDEVRLTKAALRPSQFLRARRDPLTGVSFESAETLLPRDCGYVDLKECFGALGDGKSDDTPAFREAFRVLSNQASLFDCCSTFSTGHAHPGGERDVAQRALVERTGRRGGEDGDQVARQVQRDRAGRLVRRASAAVEQFADANRPEMAMSLTGPRKSRSAISRSIPARATPARKGWTCARACSGGSTICRFAAETERGSWGSSWRQRSKAPG